jgi:tRNA modification GTPase
METATIAAIATPPGAGGIGIVKISGPEALHIAAGLFAPGRNGHKPAPFPGAGGRPPPLESHRLYHGRIVDPATGAEIDEVMFVVMRAPRSYTREDVVEIQAHAGVASLRAILKLVLCQGARAAEPGEFTQRAFLNGRIDLTQAEAVIDLIAARTETAVKIAANQVSGGLGRAIEKMRSALVELLVDIEAAIDFPDDVPETLPWIDWQTALRREVIGPLVDLMRRYQQGRIYHDGFKLAIVGRPNVGKSSLLNRLLDKQRAIVTPLPGTTRDLVEDGIQLRGVPVTITDTAGLHESDDPVEKIGISKARECMEVADLILLVLDGPEGLTVADRRILAACGDTPVIVVVNKIDLLDSRNTAMPVVMQAGAPPPPVAAVSALYGNGIGQLKACIGEQVALKPQNEQHNTVLPNLRHERAMERCHQNVIRALKALQEKATPELAAIDIQEAITRLDDILGRNMDQDILDQIFSRFCIGK